MGSRKLDGERWAEPLPCAEHCRHSERTTATKAQDAHLNKTQPMGHGMKSKSKPPHRSRAVCVHPAPRIRGGAPSPHSSAEIHAPRCLALSLRTRGGAVGSHSCRKSQGPEPGERPPFFVRHKHLCGPSESARRL